MVDHTFMYMNQSTDKQFSNLFHQFGDLCFGNGLPSLVHVFLAVSSSLIECYQVLGTFSGVDSVGTIPASLVTYVSIQALQPDLVINAGTAGGFKV